MAEKEWFSTWFDTSYYHVLYKHRNDSEAAIFIDHLTKKLNLGKGSRVLDLACGKGRHSVMLHQAGLDVLGVDLSKNSISAAKQYATTNLRFSVHDMRELIPNKTFDAVFNLFTSFGYFDSASENTRVIKSVCKMLTTNGLLVIDFMNARKAINELVKSEEKIIDGIHFSIRRNWDGKHIYKYIDVKDGDFTHTFMERVQSLFLVDFEELLKIDFTITNIFGDYQLNSFKEENSDRLIIIAQKK